MRLQKRTMTALEGSVTRDLFGASGAERNCAPSASSGASAPPLNFTVRSQDTALGHAPDAHV